MGQKRTLSPEQNLAADPSENIWVQANAGTGKTSVLVQRLLRILFRTQTDTGILCLTYTNAAAGEMRNRILQMLRGWAMASDEELRDMLNGIALNQNISNNDIQHARDIFFHYIDNPDVLKIKTIHGFCEEILHRFPLEAGITPAWTLISDANQKVLLQEAFDKMIMSANLDQRTSDAFTHIINRVSEYYMPDLLKELTGQYKAFFDIENIDKYRKYFIDTTQSFLNLHQSKMLNTDADALQKIIENAKSEQNSRKNPAKYLDEIITKTKLYIDKSIDFEEYKFAYLTQNLEPKKDIAKKDYLSQEQERVYLQAQALVNRQIYEDSIAFFDLSAAFFNSYSALKKTHNALDFDDLILYTKRLFSKPDTMGWVLSQLDLSLNHILVDEAQDTSPQQWDILRMMTGEFFTDGDTTANQHSIFVVGDSKQSIYGFQGADPNAFASSRNQIATQIQTNLRTIREVPLAQSFRSASPILETVDNFFENQEIINISNFCNSHHKCFRQNAHGLVEIYPAISKKETNQTTNDYIRIIADKIKTIIEEGIYSASDIMVLVQKRKPFAAQLVSELKKRSIDVAGSDRVILPDFPAIRDLLNLVRFCINQSDDYSLCCVLKSPLYRLTEADIFNLCKMRTTASKSDNETSVFNALRSIRPDIYTNLSAIIEWAADLGPYSFFTKILAQNNSRKKIIAALGEQVIDPLEEFLTICLAYERTQPGTMRHFLKWFITGDSEIKRDMDKNNGVRVVTVHGSKGLEAPVVFLIDTTSIPETDKFLKIQQSALQNNMPPPWIWMPRRAPSAQCDIAIATDMRDKISEYYRLLYVAMTRARDRLYIYGYTSNKAPHIDSWHARLWNVFSTNDSPQPIRITNDQ
ncbi:UvrD-helicase domain-containing protein [bacterium]|nr:UvrD-helicase domain-containing protein [bacterium]